MAKNFINFKKFGKLASIIKKIADENPDLKNKIINEAKSSSNNFWNKTQNWSSEFLFPKLKDKPLKFFTKKNIDKFLSETIFLEKPTDCFDVFAVPTADLGRVDPFELEETLRTLPPNLQIQIDLSSGDSSTNTGISKIQDISTIGNGQLTKAIRELYPDIDNVKFVRMRKKDAKKGDKKNCSYFIKVMFEDDTLTPDEQSRQLEIGVSLKDLTEKQKKERLRLKKKLDEDEQNRRFKLKSIDKPKKVSDVKIDEEIKKLQDEADAPTKAQKDKFTAFNESIKLIKDLQEKGLITKEQFRESFDKLTRNLRKGGKI